MFQRYLTISEFCVTGSGSTPSRDSPELYQGGNIPWIKSGELRENNILKAEEHVTKLAFEKTRLKLVPKGAILVAMYGATVGRMALLGIDAATNQAICHIIPDNKIADTKYLYHCLYHKVPELLTKAVGGAQPNINQQIIKNLRIPLPPLAEQKRIARILDVAAALQAQRRATLTHLDTLLQSTFLHMFGDPVTNPMHWETLLIEDVILDGPQNGLYRPSTDYGTGTPIIRIDSFYKGKVVGLERLKRVRLEPETQTKYRVLEGEILINRVNSREYLGKSAIVPPLSEPTVFESNMMRFAVDTNRILPQFLVSQMQHDYIKMQIMNRCKDAVNQSSINQGDVKSFELRIPPIDQQEQFVYALGKIEAMQRKILRNVEQVNNLFQSLQQRAFRGELSPG